MNLRSVLVLFCFVLAASASIEQLMKEEENLYKAAYPKVFSFTGVRLGFSDEIPVITIRVDTENDILSITTDVRGRIPTEGKVYRSVEALDFGNKKHYSYKAFDETCNVADFSPEQYSLRQYISQLAGREAVVYERKFGDKTFVNTRIWPTHTEDYKLFREDGKLTHFSGFNKLFDFNIDIQVTHDITEDTFTREDHIPAACK
ncbi:unnamed protein product [Moneuplotes crassus]|uniref:Uncharacterized protein n=1 Tax=Euplotes crassus TaxID=5936 RepID=A0AAD2D6L0_EUPCR|nr:unnamed protein product [Moneuplotes crassus]